MATIISEVSTNVTNPSPLNTTTITTSRYAQTTKSNSKGDNVTYIVCGILLAVLFLLVIVVIIHYRRLKKLPEPQDMGQCQPKVKPKGPVGRTVKGGTASTRASSINTKTLNEPVDYESVDNKMYPIDLIQSVSNPIYNQNVLNKEAKLIKEASKAIKTASGLIKSDNIIENDYNNDENSDSIAYNYIDYEIINKNNQYNMDGHISNRSSNENVYKTISIDSSQYSTDGSTSQDAKQCTKNSYTLNNSAATTNSKANSIVEITAL